MNRTLVFALVMAVGVSLSAGAGGSNAFVDMSAHYEAIRQALMEDSTADVSMNARAIGAIAAGSQGNFSPTAAGVSSGDGDAVKALLPEIVEGADKVANATGLAAVRSELAELTKPLVRYHALVLGDRPVVAYCPMEKKAWLQPDEAIGNPYAPYMLRCGEVVQR